MARYSRKELYNIYKERYYDKAGSTLMSRMYGEETFSYMYDSLKKMGVKKNIIRTIVNYQNILSKERLERADELGLDVKNIKSLFRGKNKIQNISEKYSDYEFNPYGSGTEVIEDFKKMTPERRFSDAQIFFATLLDSGYTREQAEEMYGY